MICLDAALSDVLFQERNSLDVNGLWKSCGRFVSNFTAIGTAKVLFRRLLGGNAFGLGEQQTQAV
jgi:hypothetical protein